MHGGHSFQMFPNVLESVIISSTCNHPALLFPNLFCVYMFICGGVHAHVCVCVCRQDQQQGFTLHLIIIILRQTLSWNLELSDLGRLSPRDLLVSTSPTLGLLMSAIKAQFWCEHCGVKIRSACTAGASSTEPAGLPSSTSCLILTVVSTEKS